MTEQAALELHRQDYFKLGVFIRPKLFYEPEEQPPEAPPEARPEQDSPTPMTPTEVFYVNLDGAIKGVLQVHKATCPALG